MTKRIQAKHKIERRYGVCLWGQSSSPVHTRSHGPGQHGVKLSKKMTDYGQQLAAKQKLKGYYGNIGERQFRNIYKEAVRRKGDTGENFLNLLESRLDAAVYRLKWAPTVFSARQIVNHRHILVNGKIVNIPSYRLKAGDILTLREGMRQNALVMGSLQDPDRDVPSYWSAQNGSTHEAKLTSSPSSENIPFPIEIKIGYIIEFFAR